MRKTIEEFCLPKITIFSKKNPSTILIVPLARHSWICWNSTGNATELESMSCRFISTWNGIRHTRVEFYKIDERILLQIEKNFDSAAVLFLPSLKNGLNSTEKFLGTDPVIKTRLLIHQYAFAVYAYSPVRMRNVCVLTSTHAQCMRTHQYACAMYAYPPSTHGQYMRTHERDRS